MITPGPRIMHCVCTAYGLTLEELRNDSRKRRYARPRQIAMYLMRRLTRQSTTRIGTRFNRNHTTVMAGTRRIETLIASDAAFAAKVEDLRAQLAVQP